ncbi:hypothetical protein Tco_1504812 [Tanacetum coccineum]
MGEKEMLDKYIAKSLYKIVTLGVKGFARNIGVEEEEMQKDMMIATDANPLPNERDLNKVVERRSTRKTRKPTKLNEFV